MKYSAEVIQAARTILNCTGALAPLTYTLEPELVMLAGKVPPTASPNKLMDLWNENKDDRLPKCCALTAKRRQICAARLKEFPDKTVWLNFIKAINHNPWALGEAPNLAYPNWKANFDYFIRPGSIVAFLEGRFSSAPAATGTARDEYREGLDRR